MGDSKLIKMKKIVFESFLILSVSVLFVFSCQKENIKNSKSNTHEVFQEKQSINSVEIECNGNCSGSSGTCSIMGQLGGGSGHNYVTCSCSGCTMKVTSTKNGVTTVTNLIEAQFEVYYLDLFQTYMADNYPGQTYTLLKYNFTTDSEEYVEMYSFDLGNGQIETVVLVGDANGLIDKVKVYDCTGSCGCREVYDLNTNKASCSCNDCQMKVTTVKK
ncbi:MAG: hypothetical protein K0S23_1839 [Fluviicola sp.]|jgi:hypothetical protein|nr:hypothetical protein [Fluviicola sp.]